eukprot:NODE_1_length_95616_cov_0.657642.p11 type:complete len:458 gc:universal NODE_1_length_95616_cov_0.657642:59477-58104(-)
MCNIHGCDMVCLQTQYLTFFSNMLEFQPVYGNANAYIMCLNLFSQVSHGSLVQYGCSFKDNLLIIGCLNDENKKASDTHDLKDLLVQLVKVLVYLTNENINPLYANLRISGNELLLENWFYSLVQHNVDNLPLVKSQDYLANFANDILSACNVQLQDIPSDSPIYHALKTLLNNKNIKDALKQTDVILEDCHILPLSNKDLFYSNISEYHFLKWAMQFGNIKKNKQPNLFSIEPDYISNNIQWSIPSGKPPLSVLKFDIESNFDQYKSSQSFIDGCKILASLSDLSNMHCIIPNWVRADVYQSLFDTPNSVHQHYLSSLKIIDQETSAQIALDVPRCHSYHPVLSSDSGKQMLRRILETWSSQHPHLEYWQGMDSIAATFLSIFLNDESIAYHCFSTFISTRLSGLFTKGSSQFPDILKQCQVTITEKIPRLLELDLQTDVITVPWFLTAFSRNLNN